MYKTLVKFKDVESPQSGITYSVYSAVTENGEEQWLLCAQDDPSIICCSCSMDLNAVPQDMIDWYFGVRKV